MEDHDMLDDSTLASSWRGKWVTPTSVQSFSASSATLDTVLWQASQGQCQGLKTLWNEASARPQLERPPSPLFTPNLPSVTKLSASSSTSSVSSNRMTGRSRSLVSGGLIQEDRHRQDNLKKLCCMVSNVAQRVDANAKVKKRIIEKQNHPEVLEAPLRSKQVLSERSPHNRIVTPIGRDVPTDEAKSRLRSRKMKEKAFSLPEFTLTTPWSDQNEEPARATDPENDEEMADATVHPPEPKSQSVSHLPKMPPPLDPVKAKRPLSRQGSRNIAVTTKHPIVVPLPASTQEGMQETATQPEPSTPIYVNNPPPIKPFAEAKLQVASKIALPPPLQPLRASQPAMPRSTPPPLGMRRAHSAGGTVALGPKGLPTKQAAFKTPFARPTDHANTTRHAPPPQLPQQTNWNAAPSSRPSSSTSSSRTVSPTVYCTTNNTNTTRADASYDSDHSDSPPPPEADSSYGDISFDLADIDEEMKKYD